MHILIKQSVGWGYCISAVIVVCFQQMLCNNADCDNVSQCLSLACFGKFLHTVIAGWDDSECQRTYDAITHHTCLLKNMKLVINSKPGT